MTDNKENFATAEILPLVSEIVSAHLSNNAVAMADVPGFIQSVYQALSGLSEGRTISDKLNPAVPVKKSVTPEYIVCLEDGKKLKMLKRHLRTSYGMTPEQYREKWGLPADYPMVAPNYADQRSKLAREIGLGRGRGRRANRLTPA